MIISNREVYFVVLYSRISDFGRRSRYEKSDENAEMKRKEHRDVKYVFKNREQYISKTAEETISYGKRMIPGSGN